MVVEDALMTRTYDLLNMETSGHANIDGLFAKAHSNAWNLERDVDWTQVLAKDDPLMSDDWAPFSRTEAFRKLPKRVRTHLTRKSLAWIVHSLLLGEAVAQEVCLKVAMASRLEDHRNHCVAQAMDEARHRVSYARLLDKLGGEREELDRGTRTMFDSVLQLDDVVDLVAWEQFYIESLAMNVLRSIKEGARNELVRDIFALNLRDESRHMGFGVMFIEEHLSHLEMEEKVEFARSWLDRILQLNFGEQDPVPLQRVTRWLFEAGRRDGLKLAAEMLSEQTLVTAAQYQAAASGEAVPQELKSARRAGLLQPEILEALNLAEHPLVVGALKGRLDE